jgi:hypothetical protein
MNCGTCKYWKKPDDQRYSEVNKITGQCERLKMRDDATGWQRDANGVTIDFYKEGEIAYVNDSSDYWAALYPTAKFGCVLWEKGE